uniref:ATP synthase epsilon chain, chloroplastic n=1 Tax=Cathaya argyrophylla TaxID=64686 RepID=E1CGS5_CATAR|nr:ATP synthase CF1 epsilon chain [Cathaya argyrophylla]ULF03465.1 CF1 subunit epsilon [Cathaya argyrophylla]ULF47399.1 CF1 subunit epsilon [Cathaya argyrophylla]ULF47469.1 CF1 subunit epsilon [Cathaya argyrophylla]ULF47521.1 CF1 subunit epsilon [Cathaya argyrophylla]ULF47584.1 CF1 subunit epsilon [Cathaya argyrophylla]
MTLNLRVLSPNRVIWDSEVKEIILSTNSGQIGVLPNHASLVAAVDIGVMKIRLNGKWSTMALMGGFAKIDNDRITVLVNNAEKDVDIDPKEAQETFQKAKADLARAEGKRQAIEADVALKRARTRLEAISASPPVSN